MTAVDARRTRSDGWAARHPVAAFVAVTYALSWSLWLAAWLLGGTDRWYAVALFVAGGFGPAAAAAFVTHRLGGSLRAWARPILRWRVPLRYYAYALGLPALLFAAANLQLLALGEPVEAGLLAERWPSYLVTFVVTLTVGGALEEPGWRGFALPRLQERHAPLAATALLGLAWGVWHVPIYGPLGFVVPFVLAFFYTWLFNRTGSVLLCILLHASFTPAQEHLVLLAAETHGTTDVAIGVSYLLAATVLVTATRGRLGYRPPPSAT